MSENQLKAQLDRFNKSVKGLGQGLQDAHENIGQGIRDVHEKQLRPQMMKVGESVRVLQQEGLTTQFKKVGKSVTNLHEQTVKPQMEKVSRGVVDLHENTIKPGMEKGSQQAVAVAGVINSRATSLRTDEDDALMMQIFDGTARAFGQVVFCDNSVSGLFVWIGMLIGSPFSAVCALLCAGFANTAAAFFGIRKAPMRRGLLAYNAVLVGAAIPIYLDPIKYHYVYTILFLTILVAPATILAHAFTSRVLNPFGATALVFPFHFIMWFLLLGSKSSVLVSMKPVDISDEPEEFRIFESVMKGVSQIFLCHSPWSGLVIFFAILICSKILAALAILGSIIGTLLGFFFLDVSRQYINAGFLGCNTALTVMALMFYIVPSKKSLVIIPLSVIFSLSVEAATSALLSDSGVPVLLFPFCIATLPFVVLDTDVLAGVEGPLLRAVPLGDLSTPEDHFGGGDIGNPVGGQTAESEPANTSGSSNYGSTEP